jgi:DivIVA domain-containing protein
VGYLFTLLTVVVLGLVAAVALGWIGGGLEPPTSSVPPTGLPEGTLSPEDLDRVRFTPALRGYRMDQVDAALDRMAGELARRDAEISRLRQAAGSSTGLVDLSPPDPVDGPQAQG